MIRVAIPIFHDRVSPLLDTCTRVLIIDAEGTAETQRQEIAFDIYSASERFEIMKKLKPDVIICCGVSEVIDNLFKAIGIQMICGIAGEVEQVAKAFFCNRIDDPCFRMPGR